MIPPGASVPDPLSETVESLIRAAHVRFHDDLEIVCEAALQGGQHGVLVTWEGMTYTIEVSPRVPYGVIHEHRP